MTLYRALLGYLIFVLTFSLLFNKLFIVLMVPAILYLRENLFLLIYSFLFRENIGPKLILSGNIMVDSHGHVYLLYKVEPLLEADRLDTLKFLYTCRDFLKRLTTLPILKAGFMVLDDSRYFIACITHKRNVHVNEVRQSLENFLREFFVVRAISPTEIARMFNYSNIGSKHVALLIITCLLMLVLYGTYAISIVLPLVILHELYFRRRYVVYNSPLADLVYVAVSNKSMFTQYEYSSIKSEFMLTQRSLRQYVLIIQRDDVLPVIAQRELHKAQEGVVVKEKGKAYTRLISWKIVIDRLGQGEEAYKISLAVSSVDAIKHKFDFRRLPIAYAFLEGIPALTDDIVTLLPLSAGKLSHYRSAGIEVKLGRDRHDREVKIDLIALPNQHMLIVGPSGMGKSRTARKIVRQLALQDVKIVILDPHGEYVDLEGFITVRVPDTFINIFSLSGLSPIDRIYRICRCVEQAFNVNTSSLYVILKRVYRAGLHEDFHKTLTLLANITSGELKVVFERLYAHFYKSKIVSPSVFDRNTVIILRDLLQYPDVMKFTMMQLVDHIYTYFSLKPQGAFRHLIVVDEAYHILDSEIVELIVRGFRKFGVGLMLITQTLGKVSLDVLQNVGMTIILGGPDPYVSTISQYYNLTEDDVNWLIAALPPSQQSGRVRALMILGPIKRHVLIELNDA